MTARATTQVIVEGTELHYLRDTADALTALIGGTVKALLRGYDRDRERKRRRRRRRPQRTTTPRFVARSLFC
jgi:hypothetical protein